MFHELHLERVESGGNWRRWEESSASSFPSLHPAGPRSPAPLVPSFPLRPQVSAINYGILLWRWERLRAREGGDRGWDAWMASLTQWRRVWANSRRWWRTGKPDVLWSIGSQTVGHDRANWTTRVELTPNILLINIKVIVLKKNDISETVNKNIEIWKQGKPSIQNEEENSINKLVLKDRILCSK